ncbi:unnamed protein product, partial [Didymodactylos carnosus]
MPHLNQGKLRVRLVSVLERTPRSTVTRHSRRDRGVATAIPMISFRGAIAMKSYIRVAIAIIWRSRG